MKINSIFSYINRNLIVVFNIRVPCSIVHAYAYQKGSFLVGWQDHNRTGGLSLSCLVMIGLADPDQLTVGNETQVRSLSKRNLANRHNLEFLPECPCGLLVINDYRSIFECIEEQISCDRQFDTLMIVLYP